MRSPARILNVVFAFVGLTALAPLAAVDNPSTPGALRVAQPDGVVVEVTAFVARATVEQVFANPFDEPVEAVNTFPLGDRTIRGEIRPNVFTQRVGNLEPGKTITVRLHTVWTIPSERGIYRLTFPLVVGPRYVPGGSIADAAQITPPVLAHRDGVDGFFTLLVQPKGEVGPAEAMPKQITFVVDTSGSMAGIPLHALGPRDTFNLIRFAGDNRVFSEDPLPNDRSAIDQAIGWLNQQQGRGSTQLLPALEAAFERLVRTIGRGHLSFMMSPG